MSLALLALATAATASPDAVVGKWKTETKNAIVEISRCGPSLCGTLLTSDGIAANPGLKDVNNKDEKLRGRTLKGITMIWGFAYKDGAWVNGNIYSGEKGKIYDATITPIDANSLKLRGCIIWPACENQIWRRVR